jgi:catechol 2,3-dioxygenase-like lactoylglutathione lyase family enzyme
MNLNQITIPVLNVEKAIEFYQKLGLNLIVRSLPNYARFLSSEGNTTFSVHRVDQLPVGNGSWIYFETPDVEQKVKDLQTKGIIFDELPTDKPWLWKEARLKDPDNNQVIIYYAGENRINPPWKIK